MFKKLLALTIIFSLLLTACSRKEEGNQQSEQKDVRISDSVLLRRIPSDTFAFAVINTGDAQFKKYNEVLGTENKVGDLVKKVSENSPQLEAVAKNFSQIVLKLLPTSTQSQSKTDQIILFAAGTSAENVAFGILAHSTESDFFKKIFTEVSENVLKTAGTRAQKSGDFQIALSNNTGKKVLFLEATDSLFAISSNAEINQRLISKTEIPTPFTPQSNHFKQLRDKLDSAAQNPFSFSYVNFNRIYTIAPFMAAVPENFKPLLSLLPEELGANSSINKDKLSINASFFISENNIHPAFKEGFTKPSGNGFFDSISSSSALAIALNSNLIKSLFNFALTLATTPQGSQDIVAKIDSSIETGLTLNSNAKAGLADLALFLPFTDTDWAISSIKSQAEGLSKSQGVAANWNTKDINGRKVEYLMSPFGIGIYLVKEKQYLIAGISESSIIGALSSSEDKAVSNKNLQLDLSSPAAIFKVYVNYQELYNMLLGIKNFTSIFTGDQSNKYFSAIEDLKKYQLAGVNSSYKDNLLNFESTYIINSQPENP